MSIYTLIYEYGASNLAREAGARLKSMAAILSLGLLLLAGCAQSSEQTTASLAEGTDSAGSAGSVDKSTDNYSASIVVAGGCFWCVETDLEKVPGVGDVLAGYAGGTSPNPTYRNHSDHLEVVEAPYDPSKVTYRQLVDYVLRHIDPLDDGGQFCDRGHSYTTAIFYRTPEEKTAAEAAVAAAEKELGQPIVTPVEKLDRFYIAEDYHQDYHKKNPIRYNYYRTGCGRDDRVADVWGK